MKNTSYKHRLTPLMRGKRWGLLLAMVFAWQTLAADLTARVNVQQVGLGETFQLVLSTDKLLGETPDLSPLQQDFEVLGTSQSSQIQILNGKASQSKRWVITLSPKQLGKATIPSITMGTSSSQALSIEVVKKTATATTHQGDITLTATVDKGTYYPFQEIPLTLHIETTTAFQQAELIAPNSADFELTQNGSDNSTQFSRGGQTVTVIERHYLLRPQKSGDLTLPAFVLRGYLQGEQRDPFAEFERRFGGGFFNSPFAGMTTQGAAFTVTSKPLDISVENSPATATGTWFLPAKAVELQAEWQPKNPTFKVGEPVTRKIRLLALGARAEQLPTLDFPDVKGVKFYVDDDNTAMREMPDGTQALREVTLSVVATQGGEVTLPKITVNWLNTQTNQQETATLPAQTVRVQGTLPEEKTTATTLAPATKTVKTANTDEPKIASSNNNMIPRVSALWWWVTGLLTIFALLFGIFRWRGRRLSVGDVQINTAIKPQAINHLENIEKAIKAKDNKGCYQALLAWQRSGVIFSESLRHHLQRLEQQYYSPMSDKSIDLDALWQAVQQQASTPSKTPSGKQLPPLY